KTPGALDPAGVPWVQLAEETLVVQSTAISGTALAVLGAALATLFGWWLYRRRHPRRPQLAVVREEAA
ncbi:MAG: LPXTG cell wall anchor domain-containing protein, partial [Actinomycetota bacterium]|nr:LPXTG cell wall anchor domain-containing protein [Actinomycetota bacterium]